MSLPELQPGRPWDQIARTIINNAIRKIKDASTTVAGLVRLATTVETTTGTSTTLATTPAGVKAVIDALLAAANTWTAAQTISVSATGIAFRVDTNEDSGASGPNVFLRRNSASPALNDILANLQFNGNDDGGNSTDYANIFVVIIDPTDASEDGRLTIRTLQAGANRDWYFDRGALRYSTQTQPSNAGEVAAVAYKVGADQVVGARRTGWAATTGTELRTNFGDAYLAETSQALRAVVADLKAHGLLGT